MAKARTHHKRKSHRKSHSKTHAISKSGRKYKKHAKTGKWVLVASHHRHGPHKRKHAKRTHKRKHHRAHA